MHRKAILARPAHTFTFDFREGGLGIITHEVKTPIIVKALDYLYPKYDSLTPEEREVAWKDVRSRIYRVAKRQIDKKFQVKTTRIQVWRASN